MGSDGVSENIERILRGAVSVETREELEKKLALDRPLRVKLGLDPTSPDVHLGHSVVLKKLRLFQDLGHKAVLIVGDYTALIGDPSGRSKVRPTLSKEEIADNVKTYVDQVGSIIDVSSAEIRHNGEWFSKMSFANVLKLAGRGTVAQMLARDDFSKRYKAGDPLSVYELLYPLMQAWDSVMVEADVELGGTDQTFNLLLGRSIQRSTGQEAQVAITTPLLVGLDGKNKMSKSLGNHIGLTDPPEEMFGKTMSIPDDLMRNYFVLLTNLPAKEIDALLSPGVNPKQAKERLAREIVTAFHDEEAAEAAAKSFEKVFSRREEPEEVEEFRLENESGGEKQPAAMAVTVALAVGRLVSRSEARRVVEQGGLKVGGKAYRKWNDLVPLDGSVAKVGKRRFGRILPK